MRRAVMRAAFAGALGSLLPGRRRATALSAAAAGAAIESPVVGAPLVVAALCGRDPTATAIGVAIAGLTTRAWPTAPRTVEELRRHNTKSSVAPSVDGAGVVIVVNTGAGTAAADDTAAAIVRRLPAADIVELGEDDDLVEVLGKAGARATVALGVAGGDGTLSAAASVAHERGIPLLALPAGTLNHFARDLGVLSIDDAIDALQTGQVVAVDLAGADG